MLTRKKFTEGLLVFNSCGGPNVDEITLNVWYELVKGLDGFFYREAVLDLVRSNGQLGCCNYVFEILARAEKFESDWHWKAQEFLDQIEDDKQESKRIAGLVCEREALLERAVQAISQGDGQLGLTIGIEIKQHEKVNVDQGAILSPELKQELLELIKPVWEERKRAHDEFLKEFNEKMKKTGWTRQKAWGRSNLRPVA